MLGFTKVFFDLTLKDVEMAPKFGWNFEFLIEEAVKQRLTSISACFEFFVTPGRFASWALN